MTDHPVRSNKEASRHFLYVASTPPHEEGTKTDQKNFRSVFVSPWFTRVLGQWVV